MERRYVKWVANGAGIALFVAGICASVSANAECYAAQYRLPQLQVQTFQTDPAALLSQFPTGGPGLVSAIRDLIASDNATLDTVIKLIATANAQQRAGIGSGLGLAMALCIGPDQAYAGQIQAAVAATGDRLAMTAFVSSSGQVTATTAISAAAPAGLGGQTGPLSNPTALHTGVQPAAATSGPTSSTNYFTFSGGPGPAVAPYRPVSP